MQESEQNQLAANQGSMTERTGSLSPPISPFGGDQLQAAAERTAVTDARFSSLQRLSGTASTSDTGTQQVSCSFIHTLFLHLLTRSPAHSLTHSLIHSLCMHACVLLLDVCLPLGSGMCSPELLPASGPVLARQAAGTSLHAVSYNKCRQGCCNARTSSSSCKVPITSL